ncbi:MAG: hypothetical protein V4476_01125 [Pseudomonadota bacterium]
MSQAIKKIGLRRQLATCSLLSCVAALIIFCFHQPPYLASLLARVPGQHINRLLPCSQVKYNDKYRGELQPPGPERKEFDPDCNGGGIRGRTAILWLKRKCDWQQWQWLSMVNFLFQRMPEGAAQQQRSP